MSEYVNKDNGYLVPNQEKRNDEDADSFGKIYIGEIEHSIRSWLSDAGDQMDLQFNKVNTHGDNKGTGHMKLTTSTSENAPKWSGVLKAAMDKRYKIAGWVKTRPSKPPLLSLRLTPIEEEAEAEKSRFPV